MMNDNEIIYKAGIALGMALALGLDPEAARRQLAALEDELRRARAASPKK